MFNWREGPNTLPFIMKMHQVQQETLMKHLPAYPVYIPRSNATFLSRSKFILSQVEYKLARHTTPSCALPQRLLSARPPIDVSVMSGFRAVLPSFTVRVLESWMFQGNIINRLCFIFIVNTHTLIKPCGACLYQCTGRIFVVWLTWSGNGNIVNEKGSIFLTSWQSRDVSWGLRRVPTSEFRTVIFWTVGSTSSWSRAVDKRDGTRHTYTKKSWPAQNPPAFNLSRS